MLYKHFLFKLFRRLVLKTVILSSKMGGRGQKSVTYYLNDLLLVTVLLTRSQQLFGSFFFSSSSSNSSSSSIKTSSLTFSMFCKWIMVGLIKHGMSIWRGKHITGTVNLQKTGLDMDVVEINYIWFRPAFWIRGHSKKCVTLFRPILDPPPPCDICWHWRWPSTHHHHH